MMRKTKILRVWGKADSFDIEFTHIGGTKWKCSVPPDVKDGQYAVEIWAISKFGDIAYWTGELFMCNGICCLRFNERPFTIWVKTSTTHIGNLLPQTQITIRKGCSHGYK